MADLQASVAMHMNDQMKTKQAEKAEIQVTIQIDDQTEKAEIQEVAIQIDDQLETSTKKSQDLAASTTTTELGICMKKMLSDLPGEPFDEREATIFRLPVSIHEYKKELCEPTLVAIGPYHHGKESLRTMEEHKWYLFRDFLAHNEDVDLEDYLQAVRSIEADTRNCYSESVNMESNDFLKMLILDGCFILEWASLYKDDLEDHFCEVGWACNEILTDLYLLENQVPFFVLHDLWAIRNYGVTECQNCEDNCPLLELFCPVLEKIFYFTPFRQPQLSCDYIFHLLHLCYLGIVPDSESKPDSEPVSDSEPVPDSEPLVPHSQLQTECEKKKLFADILRKVCRSGRFLWSKLCCKSDKAESNEKDDFATMDTSHNTIPSISDLCDAGVKFKRKKRPANIFDVTFTNGIMEMPHLNIQNTTIKILWNMVAFEQSRLPFDLPQTLSSYFALMDTLINTGKDVTILEQSGIFDNYFQNAEEATTFFNQFDQIFTLYYDNHYFKGLFQDVREYNESRWHRYRARLMQDYFNNPWTIISIMAAGILLILTVVQTYYSVAK